MPSKNNRNSLLDCLMNRRVAASVLVAVFVLVGLASPAIAQASTDAVLILHFDEGSGMIAKDASGHGNDGTIYGATWTTGISGKALRFDGSNGYIEVPDSSSLYQTQGITVEIWIKSSNVNRRYPNIFNKGTPHDLSYVLRLYDVYAQPSFQIQTLNGYKEIHSSETLTNNKWYHLVGTYDGSSIKLFVDGALKAEDRWSGNIVTNNHALVMGTAPAEKGYEYQGLIDEVAIYSKALTPEEIKAHYNAKRAGSPTTSLSLTKTASPYSIKQEQKTTVKITVENTGTTTIKDIEVVDTPPADFDFVSGDTSAKYNILKPRESRTFQYTLRSGDTGKFDLGQATATYADEEGNYHTVKSNSPLVEVLAPLEKPEIPTGEEGEKKGIQGFEVAFAIAGLLAVAYLVKGRKVK